MFTWQNHVHNEYIQRAGSGGRMFARSAKQVWEFQTIGQIICGLVVWYNLKPRSSSLRMTVLVYKSLPESNCVTEMGTFIPKFSFHWLSYVMIMNAMIMSNLISSQILKTKIVGPSKF